MYSKKPKIIHLNANGIRTHTVEKAKLLSTADVISLQDTRLRENADLLTTFFPNYKPYEIKHGAQAGIALLVKNNINHSLVCKIIQDNHTLISIKITDKNFSPHPIVVSSFHAPPNNARQHKVNFNSNLLATSLKHKYAITVGDLNARHLDLGCRGTNQHGKAFLKYVRDSNSIIINDCSQAIFTHCAHTFVDAIDYVISTPKTLRHIKSCYVGTDVGSDHLPLVVELYNGKCRARNPQQNNSKNFYNVELTNWDKFTATLNDKITNDRELWPIKDIKTTNVLDKQIDNLTDKFQLSIATATPYHRGPTKSGTPRLPPLAITLIKSRRMLKRKYVKDPTDQRRQQINELNRTISNIIKETNELIENNKAKILAQGPRHSKFWKITKQYLKPNSKITSPLTALNTHVGDPQDKLKLFKTVYEDILVHSNSDPPNSPSQQRMEDFYDQIKRTEVDSNPHHNLLADINLNELNAVIKHTSNNKAPGIDSIRYEHLKNAPQAAILVLLNIYNAILNLAYWPTHYKTGVVTLIPKDGKDPTSPLSYRPITLSPTPSKILEKIIHNRLLKLSCQLQIIKDHQSAFLPTKGTEDNVLRLIQNTINNFNNNQFTLIISTDMKQAFDRTYHAGLAHRLRNFTSNNFLALIKSFLCNRLLYFTIDNTVSNWSIMPSRGMPQGSPLSPLLFNIFVSDAPAINTHVLNTYNYADDFFFTSSAAKPQQAWTNVSKHIDNFINWCNQNKLLIQPDKTKLLFFTRRRATPLNLYPTITIQNNVIPRSPLIKILGIHFDPHITLTQHIKIITKKCYKTISALRILMSSQRHIPPYIALLLYKTLIRTKFTYGVPAFNLIPKTTWRLMNNLEHRALRAAYRVGIRTRLTTLYAKSKMTPFQDHYASIALNVLQRLIDNKKINILKTINDTEPTGRWVYTRPPLDQVLYKLHHRTRRRTIDQIRSIVDT